jgi:hypothetical protein
MIPCAISASGHEVGSEHLTQIKIRAVRSASVSH